MELVNRARANPLAEGVRLGIDLTAGLTPSQISHLVPQEPLALDQSLTLAARAFSLDMSQRDFFDHVDPDGHNPTDRAQALGYAGSAGENIAAGYNTIDLVHAAWVQSVEHRINVLSLQDSFDPSFHYDQFGPGYALTNIGPFFNYHTEEFGVPNSPLTFILGVVYTDADHNNFYGVGEGKAAVRIDIARVADPATIVGAYTTDAAGNYQIALGAGSYIATFTDNGTGLATTRTFAITSENVELDLRAGDLTILPPDDHANAGDFAHATGINFDQSGAGSAAGFINPTSDTDLFRFVPAVTGNIDIHLTTPTGPLDSAFQVLSSTGSPISSSLPTGDANDALLTFLGIQGQTYYLLVISQNATIGDYSLSLHPTMPVPITEFHAGPGQPILASANPAGRITATTVNPDGRAVFFQTNSSAWGGQCLTSAASGPDVSGQIITWTDPKDGLTYAAAHSASGLILFKNGLDTSWTYRNLTLEAPNATIPGEKLTVLIGTDGIVYIAGLQTNGDLVLYSQTGAVYQGNYAWTFVNLAADHLRPQGMSMPHFNGNIISYVTTWNGLNIAGLDDDGNIQTVWWAPGLAQWQTSNLSGITHAPPLTGGLTAYLTPWGGINLAGLNTGGQVSVTWWVPDFEGNWLTDNLSEEFNGPNLTPVSITSYVSTWGGLNVAGLDNSGRVVVYWWAPDLSAWEVTSLSDRIANAPLPAGALTGIATPTGSLNLFGAGGDHHVLRYHWEVGGQWAAEDLTSAVSPG